MAAGDGIAWPEPGGKILLGPGHRFVDVARVLRALSPEHGAPAVQSLGDLEQLLEGAQGDDDGPTLLLLDADDLPEEDIGFVRRFLKRGTAHQLVCFGADPRARAARRILSLPRSRWIAWPPDLDLLRQLAGCDPHPSPARSAEPPLERSRPAPANGVHTSKDRGSEKFDLGTAIEELLTGAALRGPDSPGYAYSSEGDLMVRAPRESLTEAFDALLSLAAACAPPGGDVRVHAERGADGGPRVRIEFPAGLLSEAAVDRAPGPIGAHRLRSLVEPELADSLEVAEEAFSSLGAEAAAELLDQGRARVAVRFPSA